MNHSITQSHRYNITTGKAGFRNWVPKIGNCKIFGCLIFQERSQYTQITTTDMYLQYKYSRQGLSQDLEKGYPKLQCAT